MATKTIDDLSLATTLNDSDIFPLSQSLNNVKTTFDQFSEFILKQSQYGFLIFDRFENVILTTLDAQQSCYKMDTTLGALSITLPFTGVDTGIIVIVFNVGTSGDHLVTVNYASGFSADVPQGQFRLFTQAASGFIENSNVYLNEVYEAITDAGITFKDRIIVDDYISVDTLIERTLDNGVDIEGVNIKDEIISVDTLIERTLNNGVVIEGVLIKDGTISGTTNLVIYDHIISTQTDFDAVFYSGAQLNDVSIFLHKIPGGYNLNYEIELQSDVVIHGDGALVNKNAAAARFVINAPTFGITSASGSVFTMDSAVPSTFVIGDIVHSNYDNTFYSIIDISSNFITINGIISGAVGYEGSETLTKLRKNIWCEGWKFNGNGNVNNLGGTFTGLSINGGAFSIVGCANSIFKCKVYNFKTSGNGGAYYGNFITYNVIISNINNCSAGYGGSCAFLYYSNISNIYYCNATNNGGGCYNNWYCNISNINNCTAGFEGGGCIGCNNSIVFNINYCKAGTNGGGCNTCNYSTISNINNCTATAGGGCYNCDHSIILNINKCSANEAGGCHSCDYSTISDIKNCSANWGGGCNTCNYSTISNINNCTATAGGGGCHSCLHSTISEINNCTAANGGGCNTCHWSVISDINNCSASSTGGGCYACDNATIMNIYWCSSPNGGGCYACNNTTVSDINYCTATTNGGGCHTCNYCNISNINNCTAVLGGGCYDCDYSNISSINNCSGTTNGGGCMNCDYCTFYGTWYGNTSPGNDTLNNCLTSIAFIIWKNTAKISTALETLNLN